MIFDKPRPVMLFTSMYHHVFFQNISSVAKHLAFSSEYESFSCWYLDLTVTFEPLYGLAFRAVVSSFVSLIPPLFFQPFASLFFSLGVQLPLVIRPDNLSRWNGLPDSEVGFAVFPAGLTAHEKWARITTPSPG